MRTFNINYLSPELKKGIQELLTHFDFCVSEDGIDIKEESSAENYTKYKDNTLTIAYSERVCFYRLFCNFLQYESDICEKKYFKTSGVMLDVSGGSAPTMASLKEFIRYMAIMGLNQLQFYIEDMYELPDRPHFGYLRGKYSFEELKGIDDYAYMFGIEVVPCMQTLAHLSNYLRWSEASSLKENSAVLIPDTQETYKFVEEMIVASSAPFRSKRIHIGMDEAFDLGLGASLEKNGYVPPLELFLRHLDGVCKIARRHGLKPMMWDDMIFSYHSPDGNQYNTEVEIPQEVKNRIPEDVELIYWNYGEFDDVDDILIDKHKALGRNVIFGGSDWIWQGVLPDCRFGIKTGNDSLSVCKRKGINEVLITVWCYVNSMYQNCLLSLQQYAEHTYNREVSEEKLKERFEFCTGASYDAFMLMSDFHAQYSEGKIKYDGECHSNRYYGTKIMWQDIMLGIMDDFLYHEPRSEHYKNACENMKKYIKDDKWEVFYRFAADVFDFMSEKCYIAENLRAAYKNGNRELLSAIANRHLPLLLEKTERMHAAHMQHKDRYLRPFGGEVMDNYYGGLKERCKGTKRRLDMYLCGDCKRLEELEEERLPYVHRGSGCARAPMAHIGKPNC